MLHAALLLGLGLGADPSCTSAIEKGVEYKQPSHYAEVNASDAQGCCSHCGGDARCQAWFFKGSDVSKGIPCRLLDAPPTLRRNSSSFDAGLSPPPAPTPPPPPSPPPRRLSISGSKILDDSGAPIRLVGFNWQLGRTRDGEGAYMKSVLPAANVARIVGILWDNSANSNDCLTHAPPTFFKESCFEELDATVKAATEGGVWAILTLRSELGAGQNYDTDPMADVFHNGTLRAQMYAMWAHVAAHYASFDRIAAYEIMSEPRDKTVDPALVRAFYDGGCAAAAGADPRTPCMVGGRPYYKLWTFDGAQVVLPNRSNVIYTFDYFQPDGFGSSRVPAYGETYPCTAICKGWVNQCCPGGTLSGGGDSSANVTFDKTWSADNFERFALPLRAAYNVPIFMNQWGVGYGVGRVDPATGKSGGRYAFMADLAATLQRLDIGWAWWTWRGGGDVDWKDGSSEIIYDYSNGSVGVDTRAVQAFTPFMA